MSGWYLAYTLPHREEVAAQHLSRRGQQSMVLHTLRRRRVSRYCNRTYLAPRLILPRCLFVRAPAPWALLDRMTVIRGYLMADGEPALISDKSMEVLLKLDGEVEDQDTGKKRPIRLDDVVRITTGLWAGKAGKVEKVQGKAAWVELRQEQSAHKVKIPLDLLEVA